MALETLIVCLSCLAGISLYWYLFRWLECKKAEGSKVIELEERLRAVEVKQLSHDSSLDRIEDRAKQSSEKLNALSLKVGLR